MTSIRRALLAGVALIAGTFSAAAADLGKGRGGSLKDYGYTPQMATSPAASWYVRFDVGHARFDEPIMTEDGRFDLINTAIDDTWTIGGGIGVYFSKNWRGDITVTHLFDTDARGTLLTGSSINGERRFGFESTVVLANVYYDFNRGGIFNPYLGVGLGVAHNRTKAGTLEASCGCTGTIEAGEERHVAAAAMAGVSVALHNRLHLDAGYRFLYLGEVATGPIRATSTALPVTTYVSNDPSVENIHAHEFRVGLRYDIR